MTDLAAQEKAVVGFDTATVDTAVCAMRDGEVVHEALVGPGADGTPRHSTSLLAEIERATEAAGGWGAVGRIAVGLGPGSFVGIRIGIATAQGLSLSTGIATAGVCTLDALAGGLSAAAGPDRARLAVLDARRGEVFAALYLPDGKRTWEPLVLAPAALAERLAGLSAPVLAGGPGAIRFRDELESRDVEMPDDADPVHRVAARHVCTLAEAEENGSGERLDPIYLRAPDAQRWRERDTSQKAE